MIHIIEGRYNGSFSDFMNSLLQFFKHTDANAAPIQLLALQIFVLARVGS